MHVTGGQYKGRKIIIPDSAKPTLSKTREGVFNVLFSYFGDFSNKLFLDLFAGSGVMSLEALSRGFKCVSVDIDKNAIRTIEKNLSAASIGYEIVCSDAFRFIQKTSVSPDVVYLDPPWDYDYEKILLPAFEKFKGAVLIVESDKKRAQELGKIYAKKLAPFKEKVYGRCKLDFIECPL